MKRLEAGSRVLLRGVEVETLQLFNKNKCENSMWAKSEIVRPEARPER